MDFCAIFASISLGLSCYYFTAIWGVVCPVVPPTAPFRQPTPGGQCVNGIAGPPALCKKDVAATVYAVSQTEVIAGHNCARAGVTPPAKPTLVPLKWDDQLAQIAERWAAQCVPDHDQNEERALPNRSTDGDSWKFVGQNICLSSKNQSWSECIAKWVAEETDFVYGKGPTGTNPTGHYTQVVAARSRFVGCGMAYCPSHLYTFIQVCNYGPAGNFNGGHITPYTI